MTNVRRGFILAGLLAGLSTFLLGGDLVAQKKGKKDKGEAVKITTVDGVELHGLFYPSPKKEAPTVILLHAIKERGSSKSYMSLAEALQPNYTVMLFDFRGHGKSKDIQPELFWSKPQNQMFVKSNRKKSVIDFADFKQEYYPCLVNDIAAVKAYLDRKNDSGVCNTANTILIGAETGATLGAIWLNSQWSLHQMNLAGGFPVAAKDPEGKDVIACVWLSISPKLGNYAVSLTKTLAVPVRQNACATVFMYGEQDTASKNLSEQLAKYLKVPGDEKYDLVTSYALEKTKLKGISLIQKSLKTDEVVIEYLNKVVDKKGNEWAKRDFRKTQYGWLYGGPKAPAIPAKAVSPEDDPNNLRFDDYRRFIGSPR